MNGTDALDQDALLPERVRRQAGANRSAVQQGFHALADERLRRSAIMSFQLEAIERRWIVAGRNHHAANRPVSFDRQRNGGRRRRFGSQCYRKPVSRQDLRNAARKLVGEKASIVPDHGLMVCSINRVGVPIVRRGLRHAFDVSESKIIGDDRPPAVGSKLDLSHGVQLLLRAAFTAILCILASAAFRFRCLKSPVPLTKVSAPACAHSAAV